MFCSLKTFSCDILGVCKGCLALLAKDTVLIKIDKFILKIDEVMFTRYYRLSEMIRHTLKF